MTSKFTAAQIAEARQIVGYLPLNYLPAPGRFDSVSETVDGLEAWRHATAQAAADLEVAKIIAEAVDGDPDDYLDAVPGLREHFAQTAAPEATINFEPMVGPPVGTKLRGSIESRPAVFTMRHNGRFSIEEPAGLWTLQEVQQFGPLHQVWTDLGSVPAGTVFRDSMGMRGMRTSTPVADLPLTAASAPFVATEPFGGAA